MALIFQLILHVDVVLHCVTVPTLEFDLTPETFFSVLSPSHFIVALWQSYVLSTAVGLLINEYESLSLTSPKIQLGSLDTRSAVSNQWLIKVF